MAISKAKKNEKVEVLARELENSTTAIVGTFSKLTVAKDFELRRVIREAGGKYRVVKNKLAAVSGKGTHVEAALQGLKGVNSVAFTAGDPVALAKVFAKWAGDNAAEFQFKLGIVDGKLLDVAARDPPRQGRAVLEAAVPDQCAGTAIGHGVECNGPRPGGGFGSGRGKRKVCRRNGCGLSSGVPCGEVDFVNGIWPRNGIRVRGSGASETLNLGRRSATSIKRF